MNEGGDLKSAEELFQSELERRGLAYQRMDDGQYILQIGGFQTTINLENLRREYARRKDPNQIAEFVKQIDARLFETEPAWPAVRSLLRYSIEPWDESTVCADTVHETLSGSLAKVFVFTMPDTVSICWVTNSHLRNWKVTKKDVVAQANANMDLVAEQSKIEVEEVDGVKLGMISTPEIAFKASLVLSERFRDVVVPTHGWPVYAVIPARDFVYVLSRQDRAFLGRLGPVVLREYNESGYPITPEVLEIGDNGAKAIGSFAPKGGNSVAQPTVTNSDSIIVSQVSVKTREGRETMSEKPLKRIVYRGGIVSFELPASWIEEYDREGGGTFYEDRPNSGTLRLSVLTFESEDQSASEMAEVAIGDEREQRDDGLPMRYCVEHGREWLTRIETHHWEVAVPVAARTVRLAIFSYTIAAKRAADAVIVDELRFVDRAIRSAVFSRE